ncbi:MAG TPA: leucine-rich repeat domain-containing protein [Candidatus Baltobacteraceae bacterium]|jgi:hypothetical protein|nr:leucine-rich repeat domain-containing protein [Candidatus Baltobacteraceae bacterium]
MKQTIPVLLGFLLLAACPVRAQFDCATNPSGITATLIGYTGPGGAVTIPTNFNDLLVTGIGPEVFLSNASLTSVTIPASITNIGTEAFDGCVNLTNATLADGIVDIGNMAFYGCSNLPSITIPANVASLAIEAFGDCAKLTNIYFNGDAPNVGASVFIHDTATIYYVIGNTGWSSPFAGLPAIAEIPYTYATNADNTLTITGYSGIGGYVTVPTNINGLTVTSIGVGAFYDSATLVNVVIPRSVTNVGVEAFAACGELVAIRVDSQNLYYTSVNGVLFDKTQTTLVAYPGGVLGSYTIPANVTSIGDYAAYWCQLTSIAIPSGITNFGIYAFSFNFSLTNASIADGVTNIGDYAFLLCRDLISAKIPASVTSIGLEAFSGCASLTSMTIPASVTSLGDYAFSYTGLTGVYFLGNAPAADSNVFDSYGGVTLYYFLGATGWSSPFGGAPALLWNPVIETGPGAFDFQSNRFGFNITGATNSLVVVEACNDLSNPDWVPLQTLTLTGGSFYFSDPQWTNYPSRFYRISFP